MVTPPAPEAQGPDMHGLIQIKGMGRDQEYQGATTFIRQTPPQRTRAAHIGKLIFRSANMPVGA